MSEPKTGVPAARGKGFSRVLLWAPLLLLGAGSGAVAYNHWGNLPNLVNHLGNTASVVGLLVTLAGFWWTLWTVWETRRAAQDAERRLVASA